MEKSDKQFSDDAFLGGKLRLLQPKNGFRAGIDSVLLASTVPAVPGDMVLDIGTGVGTVLFCLMKRVSGLQAVGIEIQEEYHTLAVRNAKKNKLPAKILLGDFESLENGLTNCAFDQIFFNPPYYTEHSYKKGGNPGKELASVEKPDMLKKMLEFSLRRCKPYGHITLINRPAKLGEILSVLEGEAGDIKILPILSSGRNSALRIIIRARKSAKGETNLLEGLNLFENEMGRVDNKNYSLQLLDVLEQGMSLSF